MAGEVAAALASLKAATDILSGLISARDLYKFSGQLIEANQKIIAANSGVLALQQQNSELEDVRRELERKIREFEQWEKDAQRYELKDFGGETFAYVVKEGERNGEPVHYLCANCMNKRQKSILQRVSDGGIFECHSCKVRFQLGKDPPRRSSGYRPAGGSGNDGWMG